MYRFNYVNYHCGIFERHIKLCVFRQNAIYVFVNRGGAEIKRSSFIIAGFFVRNKFFGTIKRVAVFVFEKMLANGLLGIFPVDYVFNI